MMRRLSGLIKMNRCVKKRKTISVKSVRFRLGCLLVMLFLLLSTGCQSKSRIYDFANGADTVEQKEKKSFSEEKKKAALEVAYASEVPVGGDFSFGAWGGEELLWIVLERNEDQILVICEDIPVRGPYEKSSSLVSWKSCSLRSWLNGEFYYSAFSRAERSVIVKSEVQSEDNPYYDTSSGEDSQDRVFLLSAEEAERYFAEDWNRVCCFEGNPSWWWLRTTGSLYYKAAAVHENGMISYHGRNNHFRVIGIRPAMWIRTES